MKPRNVNPARPDFGVVQPHGRLAAEVARSWPLGRSEACREASQRALDALSSDRLRRRAEVHPLALIISAAELQITTWIAGRSARLRLCCARCADAQYRSWMPSATKRTGERRGVPSGSTVPSVMYRLVSMTRWAISRRSASTLGCMNSSFRVRRRLARTRVCPGNLTCR